MHKFVFLSNFIMLGAGYEENAGTCDNYEREYKKKIHK
jgi:hypothetical protein